jgi:hypothetical protein
MTGGLDTEPDLHVNHTRLLVGDWTWEPAARLPPERIEEGPMGSVDLTLRVLHDAPAPPTGHRARGYAKRRC